MLPELRRSKLELTSGFDHPLARPIFEGASGHGRQPLPIDDFSATILFTWKTVTFILAFGLSGIEPEGSHGMKSIWVPVPISHHDCVEYMVNNNAVPERES